MTAELHISYQDKTQSDTVLMETEMHHSTKTSEDRSDELSMCEKLSLVLLSLVAKKTRKLSIN